MAEKMLSKDQRIQETDCRPVAAIRQQYPSAD